MSSSLNVIFVSHTFVAGYKYYFLTYQKLWMEEYFILKRFVIAHAIWLACVQCSSAVVRAFVFVVH